METKTVPIDADSDDRLAGVRRAGGTLGDTIKRVVWDPRPFEAVRRQLAADPLSDDAIGAIEQVIASR